MIDNRIEFEEIFYTEDGDPAGREAKIYFVAPIELLPWKHEGALCASIVIEVPADSMTSEHATVSMSPTINDEEQGSLYDCDWREVECFSADEIDELIQLALKASKTEAVKAGYINIPSGTVDITDPCYNKDVWCRMNDVSVRPGVYNCTAYMRELDAWGTRCSMAEILHETESDSESLVWKPIGDIGVDAGLAGFFAGGKPDFSDEEWHDLCVLSNPREDFWVADLSTFAIVPEGNAFWTSSGYGDGGYEVLAAKRNGEIVGLRIRFID